MAVHFKDVGVAKRYAQFRPHYPESLLTGLVNYVRERTSTRVPLQEQRVVDVGCGAGQSTFFLAKAGFKSVTGLDNSQAQIKQAQSILQRQAMAASRGSLTDFKVVDVDQGLPFPSGSVDAVLVGQALHWFERAAFYRHVNDSLKTGGCFLAFGYGNCQLVNSDVQRLVSGFYSVSMGPYWSSERRHIDELYANMPMPYSPVDRLSLQLEYTLTLADLIGYISSWSAYAAYCRQHPGNTALEELQERVADVVKSSTRLKAPAHGIDSSVDTSTSGGETKGVKSSGLDIAFPIFALMCQKPV